ncbi:probable RNA-binding protein YqeI, partial [Listeria monocytogenes FSL F2-208]
ILQNCEEDKQTVAEKISARSGAEIVQVIGRTIILYKTSVNKQQIKLP